jgi:hypothetical protein
MHDEKRCLSSAKEQKPLSHIPCHRLPYLTGERQGRDEVECAEHGFRLCVFLVEKGERVSEAGAKQRRRK